MTSFYTYVRKCQYLPIRKCQGYSYALIHLQFANQNYGGQFDIVAT